MPFITISNSKKLIRTLDETRLNSVAEYIWKKDIPFFNKREIANLKGIRELFRDLDNFVLVYYNPIVIVDTYRYLYPESQPAYHKDQTCKRLTSNFRNIEVPLCIKQEGNHKVVEFREWYAKTEFEKDDPKDYIYKLQLRFPCVRAINPSTIDYSNSGPELKKDYDLEELEKEIDELLLKAESYFQDNINIRSLIYRYQKMTFLGYIDRAIKNNNSGLDDETLKEFLRSYDTAFKEPLRARLIEYYKIKFNPQMEFQGNLLEKLGFRPCAECFHS